MSKSTVQTVFDASLVKSSEKIRRTLHNVVRHGCVSLVMHTHRPAGSQYVTTVYAMEEEPKLPKESTEFHGGKYQWLHDCPTKAAAIEWCNRKLHATPIEVRFANFAPIAKAA